MTQLENAASGVQTSETTITPTETLLEAVPVEATTVEATTVETATVETATVETTPVETTTIETAPVETTTETTIESTQSVEAATPEPTTPSLPSTSSSPSNALTDIVKTLQIYGLPTTQQENLAQRMNQQGFISPTLVLDNLLANSARATMQLQAGHAQEARETFSDMRDRYGDLLEPIVSNTNPDVHNGTVALLSNLAQAPSLRVQDAVTVSQQLGEVGNVLSSTAPSGLQGFMTTLTNFWTGWTRPIVMIVLGLFAFVPLYLLFLAFGGGNRNWQLIGYALFLLLVPVIYEGISYLFSSIATPLNMPALDVLSRFSMFQNTFTQLLWVLVTALAIGLATAGLYGICVQFGLLGKTKEDPSNTMLETPVTDTSAAAAKTTSFEWDEEF